MTDTLNRITELRETIGDWASGPDSPQQVAADELADLARALAPKPVDPTADPLAEVWASVEKLTTGLHALRDSGQLIELDVDLDEVDKALADTHPHTGYAVRVTHADGTGYDIDDVDSVMVRETATNTHPFGFLNPDGNGHVPGYWAAEDGRFHRFPPSAAPTPNDGW